MKVSFVYMYELKLIGKDKTKGNINKSLLDDVDDLDFFNSQDCEENIWDQTFRKPYRIRFPHTSRRLVPTRSLGIRDHIQNWQYNCNSAKRKRDALFSTLGIWLSLQSSHCLM